MSKQPVKASHKWPALTEQLGYSAWSQQIECGTYQLVARKKRSLLFLINLSEVAVDVSQSRRIYSEIPSFIEIDEFVENS
jgi:hypothetical protein